ncbi:protein-L-isoaspartate O-methyltransferase [Aliisedimentitalea scapharcae]|uniref:Protein-L-isoaspartate O-methyltransferase n=1 Tax=Aliisedimentitalea scapharcae TaxID=1524259 RepID=A0ABZ2XWX3_9RHOB|nr:protein-L-isoaspartate O-methyltransferase [Rhodobacteraceae bacterium M382]
MTDFAARRVMMVDTQVRPSDVTKFPIIDAMLDVPREIFVPDAQREAAYADEILPVGGGRMMLDARTLAKMLDVLNITNDELVLDIGGGLGYSGAVLAQMAQAVILVEEDELADEAQELLAQTGADNAVVHKGALTAGAAEHGPYDVILLQGGVEDLPAAVTDQLKEGGRIACIFMSGNLGELRVGHKAGGDISWRLAFNAAAPVLNGFEKAHEFAL